MEKNNSKETLNHCYKFLLKEVNICKNDIRRVKKIIAFPVVSGHFTSINQNFKLNNLKERLKELNTLKSEVKKSLN